MRRYRARVPPPRPVRCQRPRDYPRSIIARYSLPNAIALLAVGTLFADPPRWRIGGARRRERERARSESEYFNSAIDRTTRTLPLPEHAVRREENDFRARRHAKESTVAGGRREAGKRVSRKKLFFGVT